MIVVAHNDDMQCLVCDTVEDYNDHVYECFVKSELHCLNLVNQVSGEDLKAENKCCGNIISLNRLCTIAH